MFHKFSSLIVSLLLFGTATGLAVSPKRVLLDDGWLFTQQECPGFEKPDLDTSGWESISLPHDWSVLHDFDRKEPSGNDGGYLPTGKGWYRKIIDVKPDMLGKPVHLYFEGAYMNSVVFVNGKSVGGHPYGYTSFRCDIGPELKAGENVIAVEVDNSRQKNSRWYTGSGIYRHVWLEPHENIYVKPWSMRITTPVVSKEKGMARIDFTVVDPSADKAKERIRIPVAVSVGNRSVKDTVTINPGETAKYCSYEIPVENPDLWSPDTPSIYEADVVLSLPDGSVERESERFGFRKIEYSADKGFVLNGIPMMITGACVHHDNGILGAASYDDAEIRKVQLLKDAGFNAVRTSHNPPAPAFLSACDSIGLLVIDEAFDGWKAEKNKHDYNELIDDWWERDIAAMVERDRNHPSIVAWSIGNEIIERKSPRAVEMARDFGNLCRNLDGTRPVTQALAAWDPDWEIYDPLAAQHEVIGYNYMIHKAEGDHQRVPSRIIWQTESYPRDAFGNWEKVNDLPYVIGDFVWTGIDYIGESGIGRYWYEGDPEGEHYHRPLWPWHNSYCGDIDIIGVRKPVSYYREMLYSPVPKLHLSVREPQGYKGAIKTGLWAVYPTKDSWNWPGHEGKPVEVEIASTYPEVELYQNGRLVGRKATGRDQEFLAVFNVDYNTGELTAIAYDANGNKACEQSLVTAGKSYSIRLTADRPNHAAGSQSLVYVLAEVIDKKGNVVPDAEVPLKFTVQGNGDIIATGSGNPKDPKGYFHTDRLTDEGKALAVVKSDGHPGEVMLKVTGRGLKPAILKFSFR